MSRHQNPEKIWKSIKDGYVIEMADRRFVRNIMANGHPEDPVLYFTDYAWEAKSWKSVRSALAAASRVREKAGECRVRDFYYDEEKQKRVLVGYVEAPDDAKGA